MRLSVTFLIIILTASLKSTHGRSTYEVFPKTCGMTAQARIVGGFQSYNNQWPWVVSLRFVWGQHFCGGFLVTESHVVTAAHCVYFFSSLPQHLQVAAGSSQIQEALVLSRISTIKIHPNFGNTSAFDSDVAVLELETPLTFNFVVAPVCLPVGNASVGTTAVAVGWGKIDEDAPSFSPILHHVKITVLNLERCSSIYENLVDGNMICAGTERGGHDSCLGDSGGPLLIQGSQGAWQALGIISFGRGCGNPDFPGVYTSLHKFVDWLAEVVQ